MHRLPAIDVLRRVLLACTAAAVAACPTVTAVGQADQAGQAAGSQPFPKRVKAPPLDGGIDWLNTAGPIQLSKLKGKVVLLDFWTFCCINCIHVLPDLKKLEQEFPDDLVVLGVHSAKFSGEQRSENIRDAIMRYDIAHPVVNDADMKIWNAYGSRSWPTMVLIDPEGYAVQVYSGEGNYEQIRNDVKTLVDFHKKNGTLDPKPLRFELEAYSRPATALGYPGKVLADPGANRIFIADSSHNRIVVAEMDSGELAYVIGDGKAELKDGTFEEARFSDPQGMALHEGILYVADRRNHAVRRIDLAQRTVATLAGDGTRGYDRSGGNAGRNQVLASPWGLLYLENFGTDTDDRGREVKEDRLLVAMAGTHQLWTVDPVEGTAKVYAGTGGENLGDGSLSEALFAQPSGLATDGSDIYVADSEVSGIRRIDPEAGTVTTLVGKGLFEFGDVDGRGDTTRLQHALGVAWYEGLLYIADTYNNKIKTLDPATGELKTVYGDGKPGAEGDTPDVLRFDEPGGLDVKGGRLFVADTNNHAIRIVGLRDGDVYTYRVKGLEPPAIDEGPAANPRARSMTLAEQFVGPESSLRMTGAVSVPEGYKLNPNAKMDYRVEALTKNGGIDRLDQGRLDATGASFLLEVPSLRNRLDVEKLRVTVDYYPCQTGDDGVCTLETLVWEIPIAFRPGAGDATVALPRAQQAPTRLTDPSAAAGKEG